MVADSLAPVSHLVSRLLLIISTVVAIGTDLLVDPYLRIRPGNLIALYPFDGNLDDQSPLATVEGQQRHAVGFNVTQTSSAHGGLYAYYFDTNGYIEAPVNINPSVHPELTMGAWVKAGAYNHNNLANSFDTSRHIITSDNGGHDRSLCIDFRSGSTGWSVYAGEDGVVGSLPIQT